MILGACLVLEGNIGTKGCDVPGRLFGGPAGEVTVTWRIEDGTATVADSDYIAAAGSLRIGGSSSRIPVVIRGDRKIEPTGFPAVRLTGSSPGTLVTGSPGIVVVVNDDRAAP